MRTVCKALACLIAVMGLGACCCNHCAPDDRGYEVTAAGCKNNNCDNQRNCKCVRYCNCKDKAQCD